MEYKNDIAVIPQYGFWKILLIWSAAVIPMSILGWVLAPAVAHAAAKPGIERLAVLTVGLVWQFMLVVFLLYQETGTLRWSIVKRHLWVNPPRSPQTGVTRTRLWLWLIPAVLLTALFEMMLAETIDKSWVSMFPFLAEPPGFSLGAALGSPESKAQFVGAWDIWILVLVQGLFNTLLGEELLFRGILLPRMAGVFGKWDWVMNGLLFGLYHLHQPWMILSAAIEGILLFALPSKYFRSSWFGIIAHSGQSILFAILVLGLVLGLA